MIQICDDMLATLSTCNRYSLRVMLYALDKINTHGRLDELDVTIGNSELQMILGGSKINWDRLIKGLSEDVLVKEDNYNYFTLFTEIRIEPYPLHRMNMLHVRINPRLERQLLNLDHIGYTKVRFDECMKLLSDDNQPRRSMILYLWLCREKFKGESFFHISKIRRYLDIGNMDIRNATRRIIVPAFRNCQKIIPFTFDRVLMMGAIAGYQVKFM